MSVKDMVAARFADLCKEHKITVNELAYKSGVTPSTAYSMMDPKRRDVSIVTIKKFCSLPDFGKFCVGFCLEFSVLLARFLH